MQLYLQFNYTVGAQKHSQSHVLVHLIYLREMLQWFIKQYQTIEQAYLQGRRRLPPPHADTWSTEKNVNVVKAKATRINMDCCKDPMAFKNLEHCQQPREIHYDLVIIRRKQLFCLLMTLLGEFNSNIYENYEKLSSRQDRGKPQQTCTTELYKASTQVLFYSDYCKLSPKRFQVWRVWKLFRLEPFTSRLLYHFRWLQLVYV